MVNPNSHAPARAPISLTLPWHSSTFKLADHNFDIVDRNFNIVVGKHLTSMKSFNPAKHGILKISFPAYSITLSHSLGYLCWFLSTQRGESRAEVTLKSLISRALRVPAEPCYLVLTRLCSSIGNSFPFIQS